MTELMHRNLSAKLRAIPPQRAGSFRKSRDGSRDLTDWNEEEVRLQEGQDSDATSNASETWVVRTLPYRWRARDEFATTSPSAKQKVTIDLGVMISYRKEGPSNYIIRVEVFDLVWNSDMFANADDCRGYFIDALDVHFEPVWDAEEIVTGALYPKTANASAYFGNSTQMGITGFISRNPTVALSMSTARSQQTAQQMFTCKWDRGDRGLMTLGWKLNHWCPGSDLEFPKRYNPQRWSGTKVPRLPTDYEKGNFNGLDLKPRAEWVVPASVVRAGRAKWRVTMWANLSCVATKKSRFFGTDSYYSREKMAHEEIWSFPALRASEPAMEEWLMSSAAPSSRSSSRSSNQSCRSSLLL